MSVCYTKQDKNTYAYEAGRITNAIKHLNSGPCRGKKAALRKLYSISRYNMNQYQKFMATLVKEINKLP
jgi:recombinational DNA repair protein RecR